MFSVITEISVAPGCICQILIIFLIECISLSIHTLVVLLFGSHFDQTVEIWLRSMILIMGSSYVRESFPNIYDPHNYQLDGICLVLDGFDLLATTPTGSGKTVNAHVHCLWDFFRWESCHWEEKIPESSPIGEQEFSLSTHFCFSVRVPLVLWVVIVVNFGGMAGCAVGVVECVEPGKKCGAYIIFVFHSADELKGFMEVCEKKLRGQEQIAKLNVAMQPACTWHGPKHLKCWTMVWEAQSKADHIR